MLRLYYKKKVILYLQMNNSDRKLLLPWFPVFTWIMLILSIKMTLAQGPSGAIARSARAEAEMEVRRRNDVSRARALNSRPGVMFIPRK